MSARLVIVCCVGPLLSDFIRGWKHWKKTYTVDVCRDELAVVGEDVIEGGEPVQLRWILTCEKRVVDSLVDSRSDLDELPGEGGTSLHELVVLK